jgi:mRNA-degrading endonuclease RelE of RelBE toxin-antitoxin system
LDHQIAKRVLLAIERLAEGDPRSEIKKLSGTDEYRLRVGEWRVRFQRSASENGILVLRILPRGRAYGR